MKPTPLLLLSGLAWLSLTAHAEEPAPPKPGSSQIARILLGALERRFLYFPRAYGGNTIQRFLDRGGKRLAYATSQGIQTAWLVLPAGGKTTGKLWIVCGGNGTLALEMEPLCRFAPAKGDAYLFVDYPGYGECQGTPSPKTIRENLKESVLLAARAANLDPARLPQRACVVGHSLGAAAALLAVEEFHLRSAVLYAPFTNTTEMARRILPLNLDLALPDVFDNRQGLTELRRNQGRAWILHGESDGVIPVQMSRTLAAEFPETIQLKTIPSGGHNDLFRHNAADLLTAMAQARN